MGFLQALYTLGGSLADSPSRGGTLPSAAPILPPPQTGALRPRVGGALRWIPLPWHAPAALASLEQGRLREARRDLTQGLNLEIGRADTQELDPQSRAQLPASL